MDKYTIFTKTAKGLSETLGKTKALSRESRKILKEVDGKVSLGEIIDKIDDISEAKIQVAMTKMLADDYIREFASAAPPAPAPSMGDSIFGVTTPAPLENAHSQLTIGDFMRAMENASGKNEGGGAGSLSFKALVEESASDTQHKAHAEEVLHKAQLAREQAEVEQKAKAEEEAKRQRAAKEQAEMQARIAAQEKAMHAAEEKARHAAEQARLKQAEEKAMQEAAEAVRRQEAEQQVRQQSEAMARQEAVAIARHKAEAEAKAKQEAEEKARLEAEQQARREAQERARKEAEAHARAEEEVARREAETRAKREAEQAAKRKAEEEAIAAAQERARQLAEEQARRETEEQARRAIEEKARQEAEARAIAEAQERARQLAEEQARQEAAEQARRAAEAEAKAKQEAEEAARREAEEQARREAEARAKKEAEEQARQKAWEAVRVAAEAQAKREAEEKARKEAEEQARREAEEQARLKAEEKARKEAEEKARKEAEAQAKREAAEQAKREAEEKARLKAEEKARKEAEEKARKEAEAQAKQEAKERARQEAEEQARLKAEEKARKDAEDKVRREAEEKAREEAREQARKEAEEKARIAAEEKIKRDAEEEVRREFAQKAKKEAEEKVRLEQEEKARLKAEENARKEAEKLAKKAEKEAARASGEGRIPPLKLLVFGIGGVLALLVVAIIALHVIPFNGKLPELQKTAAAHFGHPVKIKNIRFALFPKPTWHLEDVLIGEAGQIGVHRLDAAADMGSLFGGDIGFKSVTLQSPLVSEEGLGWLLFGRVGRDDVGIKQIRATHVGLKSQQISLPVFDLQAEIGDDGNWQKITLDAAREKLHVELRPKGGNVQVEISAESFAPPFGTTQTLESFNASGTATRRELVIKEFKGIVLGGVVSGNAVLNWESGWNLSGSLDARQLNSSQLAPALVQNGALDFNMRYTLQAAEANKLFTASRGRGNFSIGNGSLAGVDLTGMLLGQGGNNKSSSFNNLTGEYVLGDGKLQLRRVQLSAGLLTASGTVDVEENNQLNGRFAIDLKTASRQVRGNLNLSGTVKEPQVSR